MRQCKDDAFCFQPIVLVATAALKNIKQMQQNAVVARPVEANWGPVEDNWSQLRPTEASWGISTETTGRSGRLFFLSLNFVKKDNIDIITWIKKYWMININNKYDICGPPVTNMPSVTQPAELYFRTGICNKEDFLNFWTRGGCRCHREAGSCKWAGAGTLLVVLACFTAWYSKMQFTKFTFLKSTLFSEFSPFYVNFNQELLSFLTKFQLGKSSFLYSFSPCCRTHPFL